MKKESENEEWASTTCVMHLLCFNMKQAAYLHLLF